MDRTAPRVVERDRGLKVTDAGNDDRPRTFNLGGRPGSAGLSADGSERAHYRCEVARAVVHDSDGDVACLHFRTVPWWSATAAGCANRAHTLRAAHGRTP